MSPGATIEALKGSNDLEEQMLKKMKCRFNELIDGMLLECRTRNDALEDLEMDHEAHSTHQQSLQGSTGMYKHLRRAIIGMEKECKRAIDKGYDRYVVAHEQAYVIFKREMKALDRAKDDQKQKRITVECLQSISQELERGQWVNLHRYVAELHDAELQMCNGKEVELVGEENRIRERREKYVDDAWKEYESEKKAWDAQLAATADVKGL